MSVHNIYSKRQKELRGDIPDIYSYDAISKELRVQTVHIIRETIEGQEVDAIAYSWIVNTLRKEYGVFSLVRGKTANKPADYLVELVDFFLGQQDVDLALDVIELSFRSIDVFARDPQYAAWDGDRAADAAISELNARFKEHGIGFQYADGQIIRIDSELIHSNVVKPALKLLQSADFNGAQHEFLSAHAHYRVGEFKEALVDSLKAIESALKVICDKRGWTYDAKATCSKLIEVCFNNGLIPDFWQQHFNALRSTLESGVSTARNRPGGHGQGTAITSVPDYLAAFVLHQTASAIVFLVEAEKHLP
jgi:hypothetical protein